MPGTTNTVSRLPSPIGGSFIARETRTALSNRSSFSAKARSLAWLSSA